MFRGRFSRMIPVLVAVIAVIALWKANNGDAGSVLAALWSVINNAAQFVVDMWNSFIGSGKAASILNDTAGTTSSAS